MVDKFEKYRNVDAKDIGTLQFDEEKYFEDFVQYEEGIVEDLLHFANLDYFPNQAENYAKVKDLMLLPIYRGYVEEDGGKMYLDVYKYEGHLYNKEELCEMFDDRSVPFVSVSWVEEDIDYNDYYFGNDLDDNGLVPMTGSFDIGLRELFYYKEGPEGKGDMYWEVSEDGLENYLEDR